MKYLLILLMIMPFGLLSQTNVIEPELVSDKFTIKGDWINYIHQKHIFKNKLYFYADDGIHGSELWVTDGSSEGTFMLKDITPNGNSNVFIMKANLNKLVFAIKNNSGKGSLWSTDGTREGTTLLANVFAFIGNGQQLFDSESQEHNGRVIFAADDGIHGSEPWITDGTPEGTYMIQDLVLDGNSSPFFFTRAGDKFMFNTRENSGYLTSIWSTDGSKNSCENIFKSNDAIFELQSQYINELAFFSSLSDVVTDQGFVSLYSTDGTFNGHKSIIDIAEEKKGYTYNLTIIDDVLYYDYQGNLEHILYSTKGNGLASKLILNLNTDYSSIVKIQKWNDKVIIKDSMDGIFISGGNTQETYNINDLSNEKIYFYQYTLIGDKLLLIAINTEKEYSLWVSDGTKEGTNKYKQLNSPNVGIELGFMNFFDSIAIIKIKKTNTPWELWTTNGTDEGTKQIAEFSSVSQFNEGNYHFRTVEQFGDNLLVIPSLRFDFNFLFMIDKSGEIKQVEPLGASKQNKFVLESGPEMIGVMNGYLYFVANYFDKGEQLWKIKVSEPLNSVEKDVPQTLLTLYPNPAGDFVQIDISKPMQLSIISSTGAVVKECGLVTDGKVQVSGLSSGAYFVVDKQGNNIAKFVKE